MIKKTLYFGNPAYLSFRLEQMVIRRPGEEKEEDARTIPVEDIGVVVLDNKQITVTHALLEALQQNNCAVITCDSKHMPVGMLMPLVGNTLQNERFRCQIDASLPLKKQLWQQTVSQKILNQAAVLDYATGRKHGNMITWSSSVRSGDSDNLEARAAAYYWKYIFESYPDFVRGRDEEFPNSLLNYGYGVLRAVIARSLVSSGLLPTLGIHHHNRYNAYCLADDIMEPYRPYVDKLVVDLLKDENLAGINEKVKAQLLQIPVLDVVISGKRSPLMVAATLTTASLAKCFSGEARKIIYPEA